MFTKSTAPSSVTERPVPDKLTLPRPAAKSLTDKVKDTAPDQKSTC